MSPDSKLRAVSFLSGTPQQPPMALSPLTPQEEEPCTLSKFKKQQELRQKALEEAPSDLVKNLLRESGVIRRTNKNVTTLGILKTPSTVPSQKLRAHTNQSEMKPVRFAPPD